MSAVGNRIKASITEKFTATNLQHLIQRSAHYTQRLQQGSIQAYHRGRLLLLGPIRNYALVGREFVRIIGRERQWSRPQEGLVARAMGEYQKAWESLAPAELRRQGLWLESVQSFMHRTTWRQVGEGALIVGEVLSLYYISKLTFLSGKKTVKSLI